ncbi:MAG: DUF268 domain-containing protein [Chlamydiae bacterium]|nr:DUF268 domain-containing protein [Chlamydiota bacterium]
MILKNLHLFAFCLSSSLLFAIPPASIPEELYDSYTLEKTIPVLDWYRDDSYSENETKFYSREEIDANIEIVKQQGTGYYGITDTWLYDLLGTFPIEGKEVGIIGSALPWYESIVIAFGGKPITVEYNTLSTDHPSLEVLSVAEFEKNPRRFDLLLSISSIEHDGLGRYGDPINPQGDLEFMNKAKNFLKPGGKMILAVPVGQDALVWNVHRIYGKIRLPMLLKGWKVLAHFGWDTSMLNAPLGYHIYQPIFYLTPEE